MNQPTNPFEKYREKWEKLPVDYAELMRLERIRCPDHPKWKEIDKQRADEPEHATIPDLGRRYEECSLENFVLHGSELEKSNQQEAKQTAFDFASNVSDTVRAGTGLLIHGSPGTGKDHLLSAIIRAACFSGHEVKWINGADFRGECRDLVDSDMTEKEFTNQFVKAEVFAISDPIQLGEPISPWQSECFQRILDRRQRDGRPTWCTVNVMTEDDLAAAVGAPAAGRLVEDSVCIFCNWSSHRKPASL